MLRRTSRRFVSAKQFFGTEAQPLEPYTVKSLFLFSFIASIAFLSVLSVKETKRAGPIELPDELEAEKRRRNDPRRPPWPLLHQRIVLLREGKAPHDDLALLWEQTRHYYPAGLAGAARGDAGAKVTRAGRTCRTMWLTPISYARTF
ncbi:MIX protein [Trypanosoma cruzi cruzi]|nr:MIX protein [Trypanosoma cruzi cruzi]